ncbi:MAG: arcadin 1 [Candidatus Bathyarchaeota archaeon]|nr:arcadin 1 [Candidatus Bathyarchaeota archaeon]MDH5788334.1 arcadin 1 [Candidatus Bathyarchaeota archaeon]
MFRVRVHKIESIRDLDGNLGKRIELIEDRHVPRFVVRPQTEEAKVVQDVLQAVQQQMPMFQGRTEFAVPKIILFLTEQEYESLSIDFDVNQVYEIVLENEAIRFRKVP